MSHTDLFNSLLCLQQPVLTSLPPLNSPSLDQSKSQSTKSSKSSKSKSSSKCLDSDSDDSSITERKRPPPMQQRKRKYQDNVIIDGDTPLNKKLRRQQQNRQAAHTSRIKKKAQMDALQQQVTDLMEANRMLQAKVAVLTSEIAANREILSTPSTTSISSPSPIMESPISQTSCTEPSSPESPISPITHHIHSPLSDSDSSMDTSSHTDSTSSQIPIVISEMTPSSTSIPLIISEMTPSTTTTTTPIVDMIPDSTRCYGPAAIELSPQCQRMENGIPSNNTPQQQQPQQPPPLTWPQFTLLICILHTLTCLIPSLQSPSHRMNTLHLNPSICLISPIIPHLSQTPLNTRNHVDSSHVMSTCTPTPAPPTSAHILCAMLMCAMISRGNSMSTPVS